MHANFRAGLSLVSAIVCAVVLTLGLTILVVPAVAQAPKPVTETLTEWSGEMAQICIDARAQLSNDETSITDKMDECRRIAFNLAYAALGDAQTQGVGRTALKNIAKALNELRKAVFDPTGVSDEAIENLIKKALDAAKAEAKKKVRDYFKEHPTIYTYTKTGSVSAECTYTMTITWDAQKETFQITITGDCGCNEITIQGAQKGALGGKITKRVGAWSALITGNAKINDNFGVGDFTKGLEISNVKYAGAADCTCGPNRPKTVRPIGPAASSAVPPIGGSSAVPPTGGTSVVPAHPATCADCKKAEEARKARMQALETELETLDRAEKGLTMEINAAKSRNENTTELETERRQNLDKRDADQKELNSLKKNTAKCPEACNDGAMNDSRTPGQPRSAFPQVPTTFPVANPDATPEVPSSPSQGGTAVVLPLPLPFDGRGQDQGVGLGVTRGP